MGVYEIRKVRIVLSGNDPQNSIWAYYVEGALLLNRSPESLYPGCPTLKALRALNPKL